MWLAPIDRLIIQARGTSTNFGEVAAGRPWIPDRQRDDDDHAAGPCRCLPASCRSTGGHAGRDGSAWRYG